MTLNAAIYAGYSSENQGDASIQDQIRICRARAEQEGWSVVEVFADHAISGSTTDRPAYQELMRRIRARGIDAVVTESLDRISRDQEHLAAFYKLSSYSDVQIITNSEGKVSELHVGIKAMMGSLYLKDLAQKTKRGLAGRILAGRGCGTLPFGYSVVRRLSGEPERGLRDINLSGATIVRRIFSQYVGGASPMRIAKTLNSEGVPGPSGGIWWNSEICHARIGRLRQEFNGKDALESRELARDLIGEIIVHAPRDDGDPKIEFIGNFANMLSLGGLKSQKGSQTQATHAVDLLASSIKAGPGALPPGPPVRAQPPGRFQRCFAPSEPYAPPPLEPLSFVRSARPGPENARAGERLSQTSLMDSKGSAFGGGSRGAKPPLPSLLTADAP